MSVKEELKPCPFCGNDDIEIIHDTSGDYENHWSWIIGCTKCDAEFAVCKTEDDAIAKWNTRTG